MNKTLQLLQKKQVAVLMGGWSRERPISLKTGRAISKALSDMNVKHDAIDVKTNIMEVLQKKKINFCFIALHGAFGEDGGIQACLDALKISYTGSGAISSAVAMDKDLSKKIFSHAKVPTASWSILHKRDSNNQQTIKKIIGKFSGKSLFVKPIDQGSALGASKVEKTHNLKGALENCFKFSSVAMIEEFIPGRELTVGILGNKILPVVEIVPRHRFYDFHSKYAKGGSIHLVPAPLTRKETTDCQKIAKAAFDSLKCSSYGRVDVRLTPQGKPFVLEVNTIPGMTSTSLLPDAAKAIGMSFHDLVLEIAQLSFENNKI
ncbi:MAG: D-alanine--D-alanine ligase [Elusimicrobiota bacterium]